MTNYRLQHLDAGHTSSGNPKRVWMLYNETGMVESIFDEGYQGRPIAVHNVDTKKYELKYDGKINQPDNSLEFIPELTPLQITNYEYKELLRISKDL